MPSPSPAPVFSVVIPTRNRAALMQRALASVLAQDLADLEVIVVDDGSTGAEADAGRALEATSGENVRWLRLPHRERGHGPAFARNSGVALARGTHVCFLDDDDLWTDTAHLRRCRDSIAATVAPVDIYFTNQAAVFADGRLQAEPLWLSDLARTLSSTADAFGSHSVTVADLLRAPAFAHLNCSVFRRELLLRIGGLDEALRYEEDRDVFYRAIDAAQRMLYNPAVIARHHIPQQSGTANASTQAGQIDRRLQQLRICDKLITTARHAALRDHGRQSKGHTLKHLAEHLWAEGQRSAAVHYMRQALSVAFTPSWLAYTTLRAVQGALAASPTASPQHRH